MEYQPSHEMKEKAVINGEPIPVIYIPRKPHPNGLLAYISATFLPHPGGKKSIIPHL